MASSVAGGIANGQVNETGQPSPVCVVFRPMRTRTATVAAVGAGRRGRGAGARLRRQRRPRTPPRPSEAAPGAPAVEIISPRNGARQASHAAVVKVEVENFQLAPRHFGGEPQLGEGHLRFSLKRVPDCVDPKKLADAINSPVGKGRLVGASFDYAELRRPQRRPRRADRLRRQLLPRDPAGDLLPRPAPRLLPPGRQPRPEQRHRRPSSTTSPTSRSSPGPATARNRCEAGKVPSAKAAARLE